MFKAIAVISVGCLAGWLADLAGVPLPWMLGPLVATAAGSLMRLPVKTPPLTRKAGQLIAAMAVGTAFTPEVASGLLSYVWIILLCGLLSIAAGGLVALLMVRLSGLPLRTSFFAAMPGGVAEMAVMAERFGGDTTLIAVAQSLRVIIIVLTVPTLMFLFSADGAAAREALASIPVRWPALAGMGVVALCFALVLERLRVMNSWFLGGLVVGAVSVLSQLPLSGVPAPFVSLAQVLIGVALGARVDPDKIRLLRRYLPITTMGTVGLMIFNALIALAVYQIAPVDLETLILATAPGGVAEMSITAKALHLTAPLVTAFHIVRILMIVLLSVPFYQFVAARLDRSNAPSE